MQEFPNTCSCSCYTFPLVPLKTLQSVLFTSIKVLPHRLTKTFWLIRASNDIIINFNFRTKILRTETIIIIIVSYSFFLNSEGCIHVHPKDLKKINEILDEMGVVTHKNPFGKQPYPYTPQGILSIEQID